jgi:hypothetical protein
MTTIVTRAPGDAANAGALSTGGAPARSAAWAGPRSQRGSATDAASTRPNATGPVRPPRPNEKRNTPSTSSRATQNVSATAPIAICLAAASSSVTRRRLRFSHMSVAAVAEATRHSQTSS